MNTDVMYLYELALLESGLEDYGKKHSVVASNYLQSH